MTCNFQVEYEKAIKSYQNSHAYQQYVNAKVDFFNFFFLKTNELNIFQFHFDLLYVWEPRKG